MLKYMFHFLALSTASAFSLLLFLVIVSMALDTADLFGGILSAVINIFLIFLSMFVAFMNVKMWKVMYKQLQVRRK